MNTAVSATSWHGLDAWALESECLRTVIVPALGAKLVSLLDKRSQQEWLAGPGSRPVRRVSYGALFHEQDLSGWDEMFPTIVACAYPGDGPVHGAPLPDHGEVWTLPWAVAQAGDGEVTLSVVGQVLPYRLTRRAGYSEPDTLQLHYELVNLGQEPMPYIWAAHPQFTCGLEAEIVLPAHVTAVVNTIPASWGWGPPETRFDWPAAVTADGSSARLDRVGPPDLHRGRKFFLPPDVRASWAGLVRQPAGAWLRLAWDTSNVPYFGLWVDEGALSHESVAAPEPTTGYYDSLAVAWEKGEVTMAAPGATVTWTMTVQVGVAGQEKS